MIIFNNTQNTIVELLEPIQVKIQGLIQLIEFTKGQRFLREATHNLETQNLDIRWYLYNHNEEIQDIIASQIESKFEDVNVQESIFVEYIPPFVDSPVISKIEPMQIGNNTSYTLRMTFATQEEAKSIEDLLLSIYQNKKELFEASGNEVLPTMFDTLDRLLANTSNTNKEEIESVEIHQPQTNQWSQL
jgi:hypothetical protein